MNEFDRKAAVVASAWGVLEENEDWKAILHHYNLGFPFAHLHNEDLGTLNELGMEQVTDTYDFILKAMELEDSESFQSFWDVIAESNKGQ